MANKTNYSDKLKNPKWQKKRLEILQRDGFCCQACGDSNKTLHVHHTNIDYSIEPWDHDDHTLITMCDDCHKVWHSIFDLPIDSEHICLVVRLYDKMQSESINRFLDTQNHEQWPDQ